MLPRPVAADSAADAADSATVVAATVLLLAGLSALDKARGDRQILQWAGVDKNYSAGIKDEPIED